MTGWAWVIVVYTAVLVPAALVRRVPARRRTRAALGAVGLALVAVLVAPVAWLPLQVVLPGVLLLVGYWLPAYLYDEPQPWLEGWLLAVDRRFDAVFGFEQRLQAAPRWVLELVEAVYALDYAVIAGGAVLMAFAGLPAVETYWTAVLAAELSCYVCLPWLRSRPPRDLEMPGALASRRPLVRRLNELVVHRASVGANTLPSGHVAGAVAAALAVGQVWPVAGAALLVVAGAIGVAAVAGRYHYVVDVVSGALVGLAAGVSLSS